MRMRMASFFEERNALSSATSFSDTSATSPSERYSAKRRAERPSAAHASKAMKARPVASLLVTSEQVVSSHLTFVKVAPVRD